MQIRIMPDHANVLIRPAPGSAIGELEQEIAGLITQALNLDVAASEIDPAAPLYRDGLGLDSIDILEIALVVSKRYGIELKAESEENHKIFRSLGSLAQFIAAHRSK
jgi:acyl carrier protein